MKHSRFGLSVMKVSADIFLKSLLAVSLLSVHASAKEDTTIAGTNLPYSVFIEALLESPEYDELTDYTKLNTVHLRILPGSVPSVHKNSGLIDKVVVKKSVYRIYLYKDNKVVKTYFIALGANPKGHKQYEGDKRTPEGTYILDYVKQNSRFYKSFHISYPNKKDIEHAKALGKRPGGMIMVHGQPYIQNNPTPGIQSSNWTNGCIALMNDDMDEFLELVAPGTVIEILP